MPKKKMVILAGALLFAAVTATSAAELTPEETLGKKLFFDDTLSTPPGQSCADCHAPETGWTGPDSEINAAGAVVPGAIFNRFGNRKPPTSAYGGYNPLLHQTGMGPGMGNGPGPGMGNGGGMGNGPGMGNGGGMNGGGMAADGSFAGGHFWDGRATGWTYGDPLTEQAMGPFLNPLEMNNPNAKSVCLSVQRGDYAVLFEEVWGPGSLDCVKDVAGTYERIARSIADYERSSESTSFSSRFDDFWRNSQGKMPPVQAINMMNWTRFKDRGLNDMELMGLMLFNTKGKCSVCHLLQPMHGAPAPLFTDFRYHNLGIPKNPDNPFYTLPPKWNPDGADWIDPGLGGFLAGTAGLGDTGFARDYTAEAAANLGKHRTPTLRNVDKRPTPDFVKAYGHNGHFKSLAEIVHFYNLRDVLPICDTPEPPTDGMGGATCFDPPEVAENINVTDMGNLGLTPQEGMAIIQFMKTLSDGENPSMPPAGPAPSAPTSLQAKLTNAKFVVLTWTDNSNDEQGFFVERLDNGSWTKISQTSANTATYRDTGLTAKTSYSYRVQAFNTNGDSGYSNVLTVSTR